MNRSYEIKKSSLTCDFAMITRPPFHHSDSHHADFLGNFWRYNNDVHTKSLVNLTNITSEENISNQKKLQKEQG